MAPNVPPKPLNAGALAAGVEVAPKGLEVAAPEARWVRRTKTSASEVGGEVAP